MHQRDVAAEVSQIVRSHAQVDDVALLQWTVIWNTVADHLVDRAESSGPATTDSNARAHALRKVSSVVSARRDDGHGPIVQRGRIRVTIDASLMDDRVELIGRCPSQNRFAPATH